MLKIKKNTKSLIRFYPFIIFLIIIIYATRKFLFKEQYLLFGEFFGSNNYFFFLKYFLNAWGDYTTLGHSNIALTTSYGINPVFWILPTGYHLPFLFFFSVIQLFFGIFTSKIYVLLALILPFLGMFFLSQYWFKNISKNVFILNSLSFISSLIYSINALMGDRITAGHLPYNLAHGLLPLLFLFTFRAITENNKRAIKIFLLATGLTAGILIWLMPHLLSLYLIVMVLYFIIFILGNKKKTVRFFTVTILSGLISIFLNMHVWLPALFFSEKLAYIADPQYSAGFIYYSSSFIKLKDLTVLASGFERSFTDKTIYEKLFRLRFTLPILATLGLILDIKNRKSLFLVLIGLIGFIFSLGVNYPFENIYYFLYTHVFLFKPFREVGKFAILYLFSLSLLVPYVFFYISRFLNKKAFFIFILLFTFFILYINPNFTTGNFGNTIIPFKLPEKYRILNQFLSDTDDNFRVAVYPNNQYIGDYDWFPKNTNGSPYANIFLFFPLSKNLAISNRVMTDWTSRYLDYIESNLDQPWAVSRLGQEMTRYIIIDNSHSNYITFLKLLEKNPSVIKINKVNGFTIFEIKNYNKKIIKEKPAVYYFGDIKGIKKIPPDLSLINIGLDSSDVLSEDYSNTIVLYDSSIDDAFYTSLKKFNFSFYPEIRYVKNPGNGFFSPGEYLRAVILQGITFYNPEIIQTVGQNQIKKKSKLIKGKYKVLLSSLSQERETNEIKLVIDDIPIIKKGFREKNNTFEWLDFGEIEIKHNNPIIGLENLENKSLYLDYLLIIPIEQYNKLKKEFYSEIKSKKIIKIKESDPLDKDIFIQNQKKVHVFSQSFSPYWQICDNPVFRVNFYGTGAFCNKKTGLIPQFKPEFLYKSSVILTGIFYLIIFFILVKLIINQHKHIIINRKNHRI